MRIRDHLLHEHVAAFEVDVREPVAQRARLQAFDQLVEVALLLVEEGLAVGDQELHVPRLRAVDGRIVDFVEDSVREGEPDAAGRVVSGADALLAAGGPAWLDSRLAEGLDLLAILRHDSPPVKARPMECRKENEAGERKGMKNATKLP